MRRSIARLIRSDNLLALLARRSRVLLGSGDSSARGASDRYRHRIHSYSDAPPRREHSRSGRHDGRYCLYHLVLRTSISSLDVRLDVRFLVLPPSVLKWVLTDRRLTQNR